MPSFGQEVFQGFAGALGIRDYSHAAWTFISNNYELSPRFKFLFHVFFNINTGEIPALQQVFGGGDVASIGLMVKSVQTPIYTVNVETYNQYNRKRIVQTGIKYEPVQIVMHDDQGDLVRNMWYNYFSYYYKDPSQKYEGVPIMNGSAGEVQNVSNGFGYNTRDIYNSYRPVSDWGYVGEAYRDASSVTGSQYGGKPPFFKDIRIFGLSQKKFASWVLINPLITSMYGDTYDYSQGEGTMQNTISVQYETVKYYTGAVGGDVPSDTVWGFADPAHYDTLMSPLSRPGTRSTIFGQGGLMDAGAGIVDDLENLANGTGGAASLLGAVQIAASAYNTFKNYGVGNVLEAELKGMSPMLIRSLLPNAMRSVLGSKNGNGMFFPTNINIF